MLLGVRIVHEALNCTQTLGNHAIFLSSSIDSIAVFTLTQFFHAKLASDAECALDGVIKRNVHVKLTDAHVVQSVVVTMDVVTMRQRPIPGLESMVDIVPVDLLKVSKELCKVQLGFDR